MRRKIVYLSFLFLLALSKAGFSEVSVLRLGPYSLNQDPSPWLVDESEAVNHELRLSKDGTSASIRVTPEFLMDHEISDDVRNMLEESHSIWQREFENQNGALRILEHEFLAEGETAALAVELEYQAGGHKSILKRRYQWVPEHKMILVIAAAVREREMQSVETDFARIIRSVEIDEQYEVSPCVRSFYLARRFNRIKDEQIRAGDFSGFQKTVALFKRDLLQEIEVQHHHQWGHYFMLAYLEAFNSEGVYMGQDTDLAQAQAYLSQAANDYPSPEALNALELSNLPEVFAKRKTPL